MSLKAIIIDFDDTLSMSEAACFVLENRALVAMGREPMTREAHTSNWGMPIREAIQQRSPGINPDEYQPFANKIHQEMVANGEIDIVSEENLSCLDSLIAAGYQLFIVTSRIESEAAHLMDPSHHLSSRLAHFYHANNTSHIKPDPRVFDNLLKDYDLSANECVYVGDSPSDAAAANAAGMKFIACFESGLRQPKDFNQHTIDVSIRSFSELPSAIEKLR